MLTSLSTLLFMHLCLESPSCLNLSDRPPDGVTLTSLSTLSSKPLCLEIPFMFRALSDWAPDRGYVKPPLTLSSKASLLGNPFMFMPCLTRPLTGFSFCLLGHRNPEFCDSPNSRPPRFLPGNPCEPLRAQPCSIHFFTPPPSKKTAFSPCSPFQGPTSCHQNSL